MEKVRTRKPLEKRPRTLPQKSVAKRIQTLSQYQLALKAEHTVINDDTYLNDYYAKDFADICAGVRETLQDFILIVGDAKTEARKGHEASFTEGFLRGFSTETLLNVVKTVSKMVEAYSSYQNANETAKFYASLHETRTNNKSRPKRKRRKGEGKRNYRSFEGEVSHSVDAEEEDKKKESDDESESEPTQESEYMETVGKGVAAALAVGAGVQTLKYYSDLKETDNRINQVIVSREGDGVKENGDLTYVSPINTGRLMAQDAESIVLEMELSGLQVPARLRYTARETMSVASEMHQTLLDIEDCYELRFSQQRNDMFVTATIFVTTFSYLFSKKNMLVRKLLLIPLACSGIYVLYEKVLNSNSWRKNVQVKAARQRALELFNRLQ